MTRRIGQPDSDGWTSVYGATSDEAARSLLPSLPAEAEKRVRSRVESDPADPEGVATHFVQMRWVKSPGESQS